jgi:hypothetical protein
MFITTLNCYHVADVNGLKKEETNVEKLNIYEVSWG